MSTRRPQSKRRLALELCRKLLDRLDTEKTSASSALQLFFRITKLIGDKKLALRVKQELDGFEVVAGSPESSKKVFKEFASREELKDIDVDDLVKRLWSDFPKYRILSFQQEYGTGFKTVYMTEAVSKYEELLERIRKDSKTRYTLSTESEVVILSAAELNKLILGTKRWVYEQAFNIAEHLEFGEIPATALETTFEFVDSQLFELVPDAAERLIVAYQNLAEKSEENWVNVVDTCRRIVKDFADAVFPPKKEPVNGLVVTEDKYLNRIRAFVSRSIESRRQRDQVISVLELLVEMLAKTDNLASRSVHSGTVTRFEAERILIYTYLAIGDILVLTGIRSRPDATEQRPNLNTASYDDLQNSLGLTKNVAAELVKARKHRSFESWDDVANVKGIGPQTLKKLQEIASL